MFSKKKKIEFVVKQRNDLRRALLDALRRGHVDFVELLIEYGASLEKLTIADIDQLYEIVDVICSFILFYLCLKNDFLYRLKMVCQLRIKSNQHVTITIEFISTNKSMRSWPINTMHWEKMHDENYFSGRFLSDDLIQLDICARKLGQENSNRIEKRKQSFVFLRINQLQL